MHGNFQGQVSREARVPPIIPMIVWYNSLSLFVIIIYKFKKYKFLVDVCLDISYAAGWPLWPCKPIFKVSQAPEYIETVLRMIVCYSSASLLVIWKTDLYIAKTSYGYSLRPLLRSQLTLTAMWTHFQGQMNHLVGIHSVLPMIMFYSSQSLLVISFSNFKMLKFLVDIY